jgi:hypothetical protein
MGGGAVYRNGTRGAGWSLSSLLRHFSVADRGEVRGEV